MPICDDDIVVLCHLECIGSLSAFADVEHALVDRVWHRIVDELAEDETVTTFVEELESVGGDRKARANGAVSGQALCCKRRGHNPSAPACHNREEESNLQS